MRSLFPFANIYGVVGAWKDATYRNDGETLSNVETSNFWMYQSYMLIYMKDKIRHSHAWEAQ
jgi:hypothetical protein